MTSSLAASSPGLASRLVNTLLAIKPLATLAKQRARAMMIDRAEAIGVPWREQTQHLSTRGQAPAFKPASQPQSPSTPQPELHPDWETDLTHLTNPNLTYPDYYVTSFHGYDEGNLGWLPALEVESASRAVHAKIWPELGAQGDTKLRSLYHETLTAHLPQAPDRILDLGCGAGLSTFALQACFPAAHLTGLDLSPYFLAVAQYQAQQQQHTLTWVHAAAENTGLPDQSFDFISLCLVVHELPQAITQAIFQEAQRLLTPGGHIAIMDMNPSCEFVKKLPPYVLTLLKSTEPYLDQYFGLDLATAAETAGLRTVHLSPNGPRHRTFLATKLP
ncbi:MAG: class I SAM-dependent methyltransferase [Prochlorothrix sp.]